MLKLFLAFLLILILPIFILSEISCRHKFEFSNKASFPVRVVVTAGRENFQTKTIHSNSQITYRFDLKKFEGDLVLEVKDLQQEAWTKYNVSYTYQGDVSDYSVVIKPDSLLFEALETEAGFFSTIKFFFISLSRYKGCLVRM